MILLFLQNGSRLSLQRLMDFLHHYKAVSRQLISQAKRSFYIESSASTSRHWFPVVPAFVYLPWVLDLQEVPQDLSF